MEFLYLQVEAYKDSRFSGFMEFNNMKQKLRKTLGVATLIMWILALAWSMNFSDYHTRRDGRISPERKGPWKVYFYIRQHTHFCWYHLDIHAPW